MVTSMTGALLIGTSVCAFGFYNIGLKKNKTSRLALLFWVQMFTYFGFLATYLVRKHILLHDMHLTEELLFTFTFTNIPLYMLMGCTFVGSVIILNMLLDRYDVSLVIPLVQLSVISTFVGRLVLGQPFHLITCIGVIIVLAGSIVAAFPFFDWRHPLAPLKSLSLPLLAAAMAEALLVSSGSLITYLCTQHTHATTELQSWIHQSLEHVHNFPFSFFNPFYFNVGARFFICIIFLLYIIRRPGQRKELRTSLMTEPLLILLLSFLYFIAVYAHQEAYHIIPDKAALNALGKLSLPFTLVLSVFMLGEEVTTPKRIAAALILVGGCIVVLF